MKEIKGFFVDESIKWDRVLMTNALVFSVIAMIASQNWMATAWVIISAVFWAFACLHGDMAKEALENWGTTLETNEMLLDSNQRLLDEMDSQSRLAPRQTGWFSKEDERDWNEYM